jgi:general secretion pathway protein A
VYNSFFGLDSDPFRVNPDPRFLYLSESHREALATLIYSIQERKGFLALTGEVGTGKTTLLNALLAKLDPGVQAAYLFNTVLGVEDFFTYLFDELELPRVEPFRKSVALHRLNQHLIERLGRGLQTLLIIDEAHNLSVELLEEIRLLSNLETPQSKLLQIVLVGQPELDEKLNRPDLRQLRQRMELRYRIRRLSVDETAEYVRERLLIAGHETGDLFTRAALRGVHRFTRGIPRMVNVLCDNALLGAFSRESLRVSGAMVREAAQELGFVGADAPEPVDDEPSGPWSGWLRGWWRRGTRPEQRPESPKGARA